MNDIYLRAGDWRPCEIRTAFKAREGQQTGQVNGWSDEVSKRQVSLE